MDEKDKRKEHEKPLAAAVGTETQSATFPVRRRGVMLVLSSPSGAGKTTLAKALIARDSEIALSVSLTTRAPRPGEVDGKDYWFVSRESFERQRQEGALLEWAEVFGNLYGTPRGPVEARLSAGRDVLFDVDWQGARQLRHEAGGDVVSVFILPPSAAALRERLIGRGQDGPDVIAQRMARAGEEISHWGEYDYVIVNAEIEPSVWALEAILAAERRRRSRQIGLESFVERLRGGL